MGNTKSFRMSDKIENMFNSIKKHYLRSASDTELLFAAIESIFEDGTLPHNTYYREQVEKFINDDRTKELFRKTCDLLEVLSFSDGYYLEDEMIYFLTEEVGDYFFQGYEELEKINRRQYIQVWKNLQANYGFTDDDIIKLGETMENYYVEKDKSEKDKNNS